MIGKNLTELRLPDKFEIVKDIPFSRWGKKEAEEQTIGYIADLAQVIDKLCKMLLIQKKDYNILVCV